MGESQSNFALASAKRPSWAEYFAQIAQVTASRSPCHRLHVGCVLVRENRIVSQGYNGFLPGCEHESIVRDGHEQATVHAEQNAVADCARRGVTSEGCTAYITHYPCIICTRLLLAAGIAEIRYIEDYRNDPLVAHFCERLGVSITKIEGK
jgi:dCMP deaminase